MRPSNRLSSDTDKGILSAWRAASIGCFIPRAQPIGEVERGNRRNQGVCQGSEPEERTALGVGDQRSAHHCARDLAGPVLGDRRLEPKVIAWDVNEHEYPALAADLVSRACLRERIRKGRKQLLILHADNGNAMRAATLESRLEELGVLRSFSRPRVSNDNPYSQSLFRTVKYRPDYPRKLFASEDKACQWVLRSSVVTTTGTATVASN